MGYLQARCWISVLQGHIDAPFRLLALGDPQLEGDSSLLNSTNGYFPSVAKLWSDLSYTNSYKEGLSIVFRHLWNIVAGDIPWILHTCRKTVDLWGNDYYLAHIYRTLHRSLKPTHVTVLGDLLGSQWISDEEFQRRGWRYWNRVFNGGRRVEDEVTGGIHLGPLGQDKSWETRIINVAGNHDIGYAGDITVERMERFERVFGKANWETRFALQEDNQTTEGYDHMQSLPELRLVVLNSLNLDTPALEPQLQTDTYRFINDMIAVSRPVEDKTSATIVLTHVPLHKDAGVCVDSPYFNFHDEEYGGGLKEQNHLSYDASRGILEGIYGMSGNPNAPAQGLGRNGIILTGHDHEGCDVYHHLPSDEDWEARRWRAERWSTWAAKVDGSIPGIREITVRSMMGGYGGNAGLLSAWYDRDLSRWHFEYTSCALGTQHIWWAVRVLQLVTMTLTAIVLAGALLSSIHATQKSESEVFKPRKRATTLDRWLETANGRSSDGSSSKVAAASGVERASARLSKRRPP